MPIYPTFVREKNYSTDTQECIENTVENLLNGDSEIRNPGMLLGKIQSGKTRTFIGIIALAFDRGYDICVVFTKGTRALAEQTYRRLDSEFRDFINNDIVKIYDIMNIPLQLTPYIRRQKLIFVVKKEVHNLDRLIDIFQTYPDLSAKKILFVDDEADLASIGFRRDARQPGGVSMNVLADRINSIREGFENNYDFLQVTATPYSLYLQPQGEINLNNEVYEPIKPAFTSLVPIHDQYIGGEQYFELSRNPNTVFYHLHIHVPETEMRVLNNRDQRYITNILSTPNLRVFRNSIINYLVGGAIRIIQSRQTGINYKSSFIIHTSTTLDIHRWQSELANALLYGFSEYARDNNPMLNNIISESYREFELSVTANSDTIPNLNQVRDLVKESLRDGFVGIIQINSENQVSALLDRNGQLRLDNPFNIFIGGQILDRGLTIDNLIGFFYGRNPRTFQQDTVLQHSRMYGARSMKDIAVTRLYTSVRIFRALRAMHVFDSALREAFEKGIHGQDGGVIFLERDNNGLIRPCAPNKIIITSTETIRPYSRFLPIGFQTKARTNIQKIIEQIDSIINHESNNDLSQPFLVTIDISMQIIDLIKSTFEYSERYDNLGYEWDTKTFKAIIRRLAENIRTPSLIGRMYFYAQTGRNIDRFKNYGTAFSDAPDDGRTDIPIARRVAAETPCLILLKQNGRSDNNWRDAEFWWPVLVTPANTRTAVFASETIV